jgi:hypothetical protein
MTRLGLVLALTACASTDDPAETAEDPVVDTVSDTDDTDDTTETPPERPDDPCLAEPTVLRWGFGVGGLEDLGEDGADAFMRDVGDGKSWYLPLHLSLENMTEVASVRVTGTLVSTGEVLIDSWSALLLTDGDPDTPWSCAGEVQNLPGFLDPTAYSSADTITPGWELCGEALDLRIAVGALVEGPLSAAYEVVTAQARVTLQPDPCDCAPCGTEARSCPDADRPLTCEL